MFLFLFQTIGIFMLNTNEKILESLNDSEYYLLSVYACFGKNIHPSNDLMLLKTGWSKSKLDKYKKSLVSKGFLFVQKRFKIDGNGKSVRDSNTYTLKKDSIKQFNGKSNRIQEKETQLLDAKKEIEQLKEQIEKLKKDLKETPKSKAKKEGQFFEGVEFEPDCTNELKILISDFFEYRKKELKKSYKSAKSQQRVINDFYKAFKSFGIDSVKEALEETKKNLWIGVFFKKQNVKNGNGYSKNGSVGTGNNSGANRKDKTLSFAERKRASRNNNSASSEHSGDVQEF